MRKRWTRLFATMAGAGGALSPAVALAAESGGDDSRVEVMLATLAVVGGGVIIGLLGYLIRLAAGRVPPPPEQTAHEGHH
ncbi:MAG TPA: hypothetical protein VNM43_00625 [Dehalococcoidia bacterium]|nr:hypothetical protein [Dehalococcoidia bacterium]